MVNLAGVKNCDIEIKKELEEAGIGQIYRRSIGEVPFTVEGRLYHYEFERAWVYWIVSGIVPLRIAEKLYKRSKELPAGCYGFAIRANGDCTCPKPEGNVNYWHIDSQQGLNEFVKIINENR
jgi:hypothetical protein